MNRTGREELLRDLRAGTWAARRRRRTTLRAVAAGGGALAALAMLAAGLLPPKESPAPVAVLAPAPADRSATPAPPTQREKDDALLDSLSDAGPVIITLPDGSRQLFLTRR